MPQRTPEPGPLSFEAAWPDVATRLHRVLTRAGAPAWLADDLIQETAVRALRHWGALDKNAPLLPWAITVARNLLADHHRAAAKLVAEEPQDDAVVVDVEDAALARLELDRVRRALERLHPRYRDVLLAEVGEATEARATRFARNSARMRARRQLMAILQTMRGVVVVPAAFFRRLRRALWFELSKSRNPSGIEVFAQGAAGIAIVAALLLTTNAAVAGNDASHRFGTIETALAVARQARHATAMPSSGEATASAFGMTTSAPGRSETSYPPKHPVSLAARVPVAEGGSEGWVTFGTEGYDIKNTGTSTTEGQTVSWTQRHVFDMPDCVENVAEQQPPGPCKTKGAKGYVKVKAAGRRYRADYDFRRP